MTSFDTPWGLFEKFRRDAARFTGPEVPPEIAGCADCGRPWVEMPPDQRGADKFLCLPCYHRRIDSRTQTGDGVCNRSDCQRHGGTP